MKMEEKVIIKSKISSVIKVICIGLIIVGFLFLLSFIFHFTVYVNRKGPLRFT